MTSAVDVTPLGKSNEMLADQALQVVLGQLSFDQDSSSFASRTLCMIPSEAATLGRHHLHPFARTEVSTVSPACVVSPNGMSLACLAQETSVSDLIAIFGMALQQFVPRMAWSELNQRSSGPDRRL